jgi:hypothetical protein
MLQVEATGIEEEEEEDYRVPYYCENERRAELTQSHAHSRALLLVALNLRVPLLRSL